MSQRFACAVSPHHHFGVEDGWGGLGGQRLACVLFPSMSAAASLFWSFWAMEGQHGRPNTSDRQKACRCNGRSKGRPCPCPSVSWAWGDGHTFQKRTLGSRPARCATCGGDENAISVNPTTQSLDLPLAGHVPTGGMPALRVSIGNARRMPSVDAWIRRAQKKGWPGTPSSQWWKRRRLSSRKVIATCRRGGLSPAVSPLCSDAGSTAAGGRRMFAMKQLQCRPSAALHSCLCMPSHPATTLSTPPPKQRGKGSALRVAWQARLARLAFQLAVELMETANRNSRHGHGIRRKGQR